MLKKLWTFITTEWITWRLRKCLGNPRLKLATEVLELEEYTELYEMIKCIKLDNDNDIII